MCVELQNQTQNQMQHQNCTCFISPLDAGVDVDGCSAVLSLSLSLNSLKSFSSLEPWEEKKKCV